MSPITEELARLDELIRDLDDRADTPQGLVREHLSTARSCLLESALDEYRLMLKLAKEAVPELDETARARVEGFLAEYMKV